MADETSGQKSKGIPPIPDAAESWARQAWTHLESVRQATPLIQCITNFVSMDLVANVLLSAGASPAMIHAAEEIPDFTPQIHGLYINVGTLTPAWLPAMKAAAQVANERNKPWVLDPVASGASGYRLKACLELLKLKPTVVRGNGSEILALFRGSLNGTSKGVDSLHESTEAVEAAKSLAQISGSIIAVSGAVDIVTDGERVVGVRNGVPMLQKITAAGCSVTALIAAFVAVNPQQPLEATATALSVFGMCGEIGLEKAGGPASLRLQLIDALNGLDRDTLHHRAKIENM
ncbi:hydroxyethylthiazole kinase [Andrographis paniculata]|uniref:hydroxyethylthiazole kinase n=1 Tax=Andrographis paniculata TaxID=175694 RepID=UPI0021E7C4B8|nr:hydroxyethylthiazole kinase [Andrographis paniculata]